MDLFFSVIDFITQTWFRDRLDLSRDMTDHFIWFQLYQFLCFLSWFFINEKYYAKLTLKVFHNSMCKSNMSPLKTHLMFVAQNIT